MTFNEGRRQALRAGGVASVASALPGLALAQAGLVPLEDFLRSPVIFGLVLSPDGTTLAGIRDRNGRDNLFVLEIATRKLVTITNFSDSDVVSPRWISNNRLVFGVVDRKRGSGDQVGEGLFAIDKNAEDFRELVARGFLTDDARLLTYSTFMYGKGVGSGPDEVLVSIYSSGGRRGMPWHSQVHRLNTRTGRTVLLTGGGPQRASGWIFDTKGVPRVCHVAEADGMTQVYHRAAEQAEWKPLFSHAWNDPNAIEPVAFDGEGRLYVLARAGSDFTAVHEYDLQAGKLGPEPVMALKGYDLTAEPPLDRPAVPGAPLSFDDKQRLVGVAYHAERRGTLWLDEERRKLQEALEAVLPNKVVSFSGNVAAKDKPLLVVASGDTQAVSYYLYYPGKRQIEGLSDPRPWLKPEQMAPMSVYQYKARDGLSIPATLTLPRTGNGKNLPLVVLHYGGPWVRAIRWGFDARVQFLVSRGYAVMMPAPRASTGFGWKHYRAGWKQWGLGMQDDVTDGVRDLIARGVVDAKRVCIAGASYGGYLAMMGLAKDPELYRCGINWVGVTDPELMYIEWTDFAASSSREVNLPVTLGHPKTDAEQFARTSPLKRAAEIKQPVLMAYGGSDRRVPIVNGESMRDALAKHNPNVEWVVYGDEGHNWLKRDSNLDFWRRVEAFLAKNMPAA
jgi:dipeptidyl aminopeptidase/acylaminoacyl peptidase